jgi:putative ABC transport system permease protein
VIGVIEDYHFQTFDKEIIPIVLFFDLKGWANNLLIKLTSADYQSGLKMLEKRWSEAGIESPLHYSFIDEWVVNLTKRESQLSSMVSMFTSISMIITILGLLGLISYTMERRKKEIGIRKVLGASVNDILVMVNKRYVKYILAAFVIAVPLSAYGIEKWLQNFAYRISITPFDYLITAVAVLTIAILTISLQSLNAAAVNPVDTLKEE